MALAYNNALMIVDDLIYNNYRYITIDSDKTVKVHTSYARKIKGAWQSFGECKTLGEKMFPKNFFQVLSSYEYEKKPMILIDFRRFVAKGGMQNE